MPISNESAPEWARLPTGRLLQVPVRPKLITLAERLEKTHGPPGSAIASPKSILASAAAKLAASKGDLETLTHRERKATIELCWGKFGKWEPKAADVRNWLVWAERDWNSRFCVSRVAVSYVRNLDPTVEATKIVGNWLAGRAKEIQGAFGDFFRDYALYDSARAVEWMSRSLGNGDPQFLSRIAADLKTSVVARGSGLLVSLIGAYGKLCAAPAASNVAEVSRTLLRAFGEAGIGEKGSREFRESARASMVVGIVAWASRDGGPEAIERAIETCLSLAGDPRQSMASWDRIPFETLAEVEAWLTKRTIENLFLVIDTLRTDRPDQWKARRAFWRSYLPYIKRAYLVCANDAMAIADQFNEPYGTLKNCDHRHCGVLMQIVGPSGDKLVVLEINKNASALFWWPGSDYAPPFYSKGDYDRRSYLNSCDETKAHMPPHWPHRFADLIEGQTGIRRPASVNQIG